MTGIARSDLKGYNLSTRAVTAMVNSSYTGVEELKKAFKANPDVVYDHFSRLPNTGAATVKEIFRVFELDYPFKERQHRISSADDLLREIANANPNGWDPTLASKASTVFLIDLLADELVARTKAKRFVLTEHGAKHLDSLREAEQMVVQLRGTRKQVRELVEALAKSGQVTLSNALLDCLADNQPINL